jgi:parallel beta-helix repeat protein
LKFAFVALLVASPAAAQQCGTLTTCPPVSTPLAGTELLYMVQGGVSKKMTVTQLGLVLGPYFALTPGVSPIAPTTNGGVLWDNNGVLRDSTTLPSGLTLPSVNLTGTVEVGGNAMTFPGAPATLLYSGSTAGGDLTGTLPSPTIAANAVTNGKAAQMAAMTFKGNNSAGPSNPLDLTLAQTQSALGIPSLPNVSGSALTTTATCSASSPVVTLAATLDFQNGQGIRVDHCGASFALNQPTGLSVTPTGTPGSTAYAYTIEAIDAAGGVGMAVSNATTSIGNATLSTTNYNALAWSAPSGTAPSAYAIFGNNVGSLTLIGIVPVGTTTFKDIGAGAVSNPDWLPAAPQTISALPDWLLTTISSGAGTLNLVLASNSTNAIAGQPIAHDDTVAMQAALTASASGLLTLPCGAYNITAALSETLLKTFWVHGGGTCTQIQSQASKSINVLVFNPSTSNQYAGPSVVVEDTYYNKPWVPGGSVILLTNEPRAVVRYNTMYSSYAQGIVLTTSYGPTIEHNEIYNTLGAAIVCNIDLSCNDARILDNGFYSDGLTNSALTIYIGGSGEAPSGFIIDGNDIEGCYGGIDFGSSSGGDVFGNYIENSTSANLYFSGANSSLLFSGNWFGASPSLSLASLTNSEFNENATYNYAITQGSAPTVSGSKNTAAGTGGISLVPPALSTWSCTIPDTAGPGVYFCPWQAANTAAVATFFDDFSVTYNSTCSTTYPIVSIYDITKSSVLGSTTVPNTSTTVTSVNASASGAAAGDQYGFRVTTGGSGCSSTLATEFIYLTASMRN